jgi:hypothetical protein
MDLFTAYMFASRNFFAQSASAHFSATSEGISNDPKFKAYYASLKQSGKMDAKNVEFQR